MQKRSKGRTGMTGRRKGAMRSGSSKTKLQRNRSLKAVRATVPGAANTRRRSQKRAQRRPRSRLTAKRAQGSHQWM